MAKFIKQITLAVLLLFAVSCGDDGKGEYSIPATSLKTNWELEIVIHTDKGIQEAYAKAIGEHKTYETNVNSVEAFNVRTPTKCTVHLIEPNGKRPKVWIHSIGHEVNHCLMGDWHDLTSGKYPSRITVTR